MDEPAHGGHYENVLEYLEQSAKMYPDKMQ